MFWRVLMFFWCFFYVFGVTQAFWFLDLLHDRTTSILDNVGSVTDYTFFETGTCLCLCSYNGSNYDPITTFISCIYLSIDYASYVLLNIYVHVFLLYVLKRLQTSLGIKIILHLASRKPIMHLITEWSMFRNLVPPFKWKY